MRYLDCAGNRKRRMVTSSLSRLFLLSLLRYADSTGVRNLGKQWVSWWDVWSAEVDVRVQLCGAIWILAGVDKTTCRHDGISRISD